MVYGKKHKDAAPLSTCCVNFFVLSVSWSSLCCADVYTRGAVVLNVVVIDAVVTVGLINENVLCK